MVSATKSSRIDNARAKAAEAAKNLNILIEREEAKKAIDAAKKKLQSLATKKGAKK